MKNSYNAILLNTLIMLTAISLVFFTTFNVLATPLSDQQVAVKSTYNHKLEGSIETSNLVTHYQVAGPFFSTDTSTVLDINTYCCDQFSNVLHTKGEVLEQWIGPEVIEIKYNNDRINLFSHINSSLNGFCITDTSKQLGIVITEGSDAPAAIDQFRYLLLYNPITQKFDSTRFDQLNSWDSDRNEMASISTSIVISDKPKKEPLVSCPKNSTLLPRSDGIFTPCTCNMTLIEETKSLEELLYSIEGSNDLIANSSKSLYNEDNDEPLHFATVSIDTVNKIKSYAQSAFVNSLSFEQVITAKMQMIVFTYWKPIYETHSRVLAKTTNAKHWKLIYSAYPNSKGFSPPVFSRVLSDQQVELLMCVDGCDWKNGNSSAKVKISNKNNDFFLHIIGEVETSEYRSEINKLIEALSNKRY